MATKQAESHNLYLFQRTDKKAEHVILFAHGIKASGPKFKIPAKKQVLHYINDHQTFTLGPTSFEWAFQGKLAPLEPLDAGDDATDYTLTKAAGTHIENKAARRDYEDLTAEVEGSEKVKGALDPTAVHLLGKGVPCDILSIRNRFAGTTQTLKSVLSDDLLKPYKYVHCFFCRAWNDGKDTARAPNKVR